VMQITQSETPLAARAPHQLAAALLRKSNRVDGAVGATRVCRATTSRSVLIPDPPAKKRQAP